MYNILICDDEKDIVNALKIYLNDSQYQFLEACNGKQALEIMEKEEIHLVLLDIMMPVMDGIETLSKIRQFSNVPVIFLTAKSEEVDMILGLNLGADDYITKPFGTNELLARVRDALRGYRRREKEENLIKDAFSVADMKIDYEYRRITVAGQEIKLTQTEYNVLELLSMHAGRVMTYSEINKKVWGYSDSGSIKKLQVNMANIRKKLGEKPGENKYIANELGIGYRMNVDSE